MKKNIEILKKHGLKNTNQRKIMSDILFAGKDMHFSAEDLKKLVEKRGFKMSLATIYNNLQHFVNAGLLRKTIVDSEKSYYDNNLKNHYHIYDEADRKLIDIPNSSISFSKLPKLPKNKVIKNISVIIQIDKNSR
tara:strand:+ start:719 stop:1123 length:405 start_codon:yes stop_codon:yes gene_type:complete